MNKYKFKIKNRKISIYTTGNLLRSPELLRKVKATFELKGKSSGVITLIEDRYVITKLKGHLSRDAEQLLAMVVRNEIFKLVPQNTTEELSKMVV